MTAATLDRLERTPAPWGFLALAGLGLFFLAVAAACAPAARIARLTRGARCPIP